MDNDYIKIINNLKFKIILYDAKILARVEVDFCSPPIIIKGFTVKKNAEGVIFASPPAFGNRFGKMSPIIWSPKDFWDLLSQKIIEEYQTSIGDTKNNDEIDISDIPF